MTIEEDSIKPVTMAEIMMHMVDCVQCHELWRTIVKHTQQDIQGDSEMK